MKNIQRVTGIFMTAVALLALSCTAGFAQIAPQDAFQNTNLVLLTQNHGRSLWYDIDSILGGSNSLHSTYMFGANLNANDEGGLLSITVNYNTPLEKGNEAIYFVSGVVFTFNTITRAPEITPVFQYVYASQGAFALQAYVPKMTFAFLYTGVLYSTNNDFPVTLFTKINLDPVFIIP